MNANHHSFIHRTRVLFRLASEESLKSLRANLIPGLILQAVMAAMAAAYLWHPGARHLFTELARIRSDWGLWFSFLGTSLASALLPEILQRFRGASLEKGPSLGERLLFAIPFWGLIGVQVDLFYRLQLHLFGPSESISVIVTKVLVDAFIYCPLLAMPEAVCVFLWRDHGFTSRGFRGWTAGRFYALRIFPVLMANWMVWIPLVSIIYSLPPALGIPFFIIAQAFWVMVFTTLSARSGKRV